MKVVNHLLRYLTRYIYIILGYNPEIIGIILDKDGWANVNELIDKINYKDSAEFINAIVEVYVGIKNLDDETSQMFKKYLEKAYNIIDTDKLIQIVENADDVFSFNEDRTKIRANHRHLIDAGMSAEYIPPDELFYGTGKKFVDIIKKEGLKPTDHFVHLYSDYKTALSSVEPCHEKRSILSIDTQRMVSDKIKFYRENGVWLTEYVDPKYIRPYGDKDDWIQSYLSKFPGSREDVLTFIANILFHGSEGSNDIYELFASGYCYYFARMLEDAFGGSVCWHKGFGHIIWKDENDVCYDIGGVFYDYGKDEIVPLTELTSEELEGFRHRK